MKTINKLMNRKAVSPVIATVILVAVAISVSIGVSYWMSGISAQYTEFEKVEIQTGYATYDSTEGWTVMLSLKNSGSATATLTNVFVNDAPIPDALYGSGGFGDTAPLVNAGKMGTDVPEDGLSLEAGESNTIEIYISNAGTDDSPAEFLSSGTTVNIKLHSAGGMDYIKLVKLT